MLSTHRRDRSYATSVERREITCEHMYLQARTSSNCGWSRNSRAFCPANGSITLQHRHQQGHNSESSSGLARCMAIAGRSFLAGGRGPQISLCFYDSIIIPTTLHAENRYPVAEIQCTHESTYNNKMQIAKRKLDRVTEIRVFIPQLRPSHCTPISILIIGIRFQNLITTPLL